MLRLIGWLFGFGIFVGVIAAIGGGIYLTRLTAELPDYTVLKDYQPPVTTRVHAADGTLLAEYARERRLFQPIETIPPMSSRTPSSRRRTRTSIQHGGIDFVGIIRAVARLWRGQARGQTIPGWRAPRPSPSRWPRTSS